MYERRCRIGVDPACIDAIELFVLQSGKYVSGEL